MPPSEIETSRNMLINLKIQESARCNDVWSTDTTTTKQCSSKVTKKLLAKTIHRWWLNLLQRNMPIASINCKKYAYLWLTKWQQAQWSKVNSWEKPKCITLQAFFKKMLKLTALRLHIFYVHFMLAHMWNLRFLFLKIMFPTHIFQIQVFKI